MRKLLRWIKVKLWNIEYIKLQYRIDCLENQNKLFKQQIKQSLYNHAAEIKIRDDKIKLLEERIKYHGK
jgi:hypothetical protein